MYYGICIFLGNHLALLGLLAKYGKLSVILRAEIKGFKTDIVP